MVKKCSFSIILLVIMVSCKDNVIQQDIDALQTEQTKQDYLEDILEKDQVYRKRSGDLVQRHGHDSDEVQENDRLMMETDKLNVKKISAYLDTYGYPSYSRYGSEANTAPWMVFHHSNNYEIREKYFPMFYKAWKEKAMGGDDLSFYLNRMYRMKKGNLVKMPGAFRDEDLIDTIMKSLDLDPNIK